MEPLYGYKDLAEFCEFVIASLFDVAPSSPSASTISSEAGQREGIDTPPYTPPPEREASTSSSSSQQRKEPPALIEFIAYALYRTRLPTSIVHQSLLLLSRLKARYPSARGTSSSPHRLFLSSLMLSAKISMDDTYSNKSWAIVGSSYFPLREVNQMERELFAFLGWNVVVSQEELDSFIASAQASFAAAKASKKAERAKRRRLEEEEAREARHRQATNAARALLRPHTYRHQTSPSPTRGGGPIASSNGMYTPVSQASPSMSASPVASTSSNAASPRVVPQYTYGAPATAASSCSNSRASSPHARRAPYTPSSCSSSQFSSAVSSTFPSATHSPTSPASEPFSAGPQTPDSDFHYLHQHPHHQQTRWSAHQPPHHHHESSDFPEADSYMASSSKQQQQQTYSSMPVRKFHHQQQTSPSFLQAFAQQVQA